MTAAQVPHGDDFDRLRPAGKLTCELLPPHNENGLNDSWDE